MESNRFLQTLYYDSSVKSYFTDSIIEKITDPDLESIIYRYIFQTAE